MKRNTKKNRQLTKNLERNQKDLIFRSSSINMTKTIKWNKMQKRVKDRFKKFFPKNNKSLKGK